MKTAMLIGVLMGIPMYASSTNCLAGAASVPTLGIASTSAAVGDFTLSCTNSGFVDGPSGFVTFDFVLAVDELNTGSWTLTESVYSNNYVGSLFGTNDVRFTGVPYDTNNPSYLFELHGVEVNPSLNPPSFPYNESVSISGAVSVPITDPEQLVATNGTPEPSTLLLAAAGVLGTLVANLTFALRR